MGGFLNFFRRKKSVGSNYDFWKLVDFVGREDFAGVRQQVICDIDKTYLETEFESLIKIARIALETAEDKITVLGASAVLEALRWNDQSVDPPHQPRPVHFISSSPPQLRTVLEEKLTLDGLDWSSDTFKNQAYNVLKGRVDLLSHHIAYKSAAILNVMSRAGSDVAFTLIGDNAESDAYIYTGVAAFCGHVLTPDEYRRYLEIGGVDSKVASDIGEAFATPPSVAVEYILIRNAPGYRFVDMPLLTSDIILFDHYFGALIELMRRHLISSNMLERHVREFHNRCGFSERVLISIMGQHLFPDQATPNELGSLAEYSQLLFEALQKNRFSPKPILEGVSAEEVLHAAETWVSKLSGERRLRREPRKK
jgi:hypothetical protein